jgi:hypothetical protein
VEAGYNIATVALRALETKFNPVLWGITGSPYHVWVEGKAEDLTL